MRYLAIHLLELAGVETPGEKIGKVGVNVAGVTVNDPNHIINIQDAKSVDILVGPDKFTAAIPETQDAAHEEAVREQREIAGRKATEDAEKRKKAADGPTTE